MYGKAVPTSLICVQFEGECTGGGRLQLPWTLTENNSINSLIIILTSVIQFILLNHGAWECLDWKEPTYAHHCCPTSFREQTFLDP